MVKSQPYQGEQRNMDYHMQYRYVFHKDGAPAADRLRFSGELTPRRGLGTLTVRLHFLDASGEMLATEILYASGKGQGAGRAKIDREITVPPSDVAIAFSHFSQNNTSIPRLRR